MIDEILNSLTLYKVTFHGEVVGIVNNIKNGESYTVLGWENTYTIDDDILKYTARYRVR